jgi:hypothetical protein
MQAPLKDFPCDEVREFLKSLDTTFAELDAAARCESCDWGLTERIREKGINTLLPDVQECREFASFLQLKIRLEVAERRYGDAIRSIQTGYALARHVADQPSVICALVGIAISQIITARLEELLQQPDAPNLYWALTDLPRPFVSLRKPLQGERIMVYATFPGMAEVAADPNAGPLNEEQMKKLAEQVRALLNDQGGEEWKRLKGELDRGLRLSERYEAVKRRLIAEGRPKEKVDAMPPLQGALLDALERYDRYLEDVMAVESLPAWQARPVLEAAEKRRKEEDARADGPALSTDKMLPALTKLFNARTRIDRRLAALRCVEAVRLYAAAHGGQLPKSLSEIKEVPIPVDPLTGQDFLYTVEADRAVLATTPSPSEPPALYNSPAYELLPQH